MTIAEICKTVKNENVHYDLRHFSNVWVIDCDVNDIANLPAVINTLKENCVSMSNNCFSFNGFAVILKAEKKS